MLLVRPVTMQDHDEILALARLAGIGMSSLPPEPLVLEKKIQRAERSFAGTPEFEDGHSFLFVLEDTHTGKLAGTAGVVAHVGMRRPFYSYKLSTIVQAAQNLDVYTLQHVLHMVNDYTGASEIGSLFLAPEYRRDGIGRFLARSRYLMVAEFPELFSDIMISEIRGVQDAYGDSPFYDNIAKHFFQMDFKRADYIYATQGGQFIADLMPRYPIYTILLPEEAQAVIGKTYSASEPAKRLLEKEGFSWQGYVDVFDAGPTMQVETPNITTVQQSRECILHDVVGNIDGETMMVSNAVQKNFRVLLAPVKQNGENITLDKDVAELLQVKKGDRLRVVV